MCIVDRLQKVDMNLYVAILFAFSLFVQSNRFNPQEWKKIVPMNTTRANVEAILGPADKGFEVLYQLQDGKLSIEYSTGPCTSERKGGWNVPDMLSLVSTFLLDVPRNSHN